MAETISEDPLNAPPPVPVLGSSPTLPDYSEMIMAAVEALKDTNGSNESEIAKYIESTYVDLPAEHTTLLPNHLDKMKQAGQLIMIENNYMKPDLNAPPKRGRGRPPKAKVPVPAGIVTSPPRPRGRPPKPRDPFAEPAPVPAGIVVSSPRPRGRPPKPRDPFAEPKVPSGSGRPRGRPPKKAKIAAAPVASSPGGAPRGRGRPPKVKPAVELEPVAG